MKKLLQKLEPCVLMYVVDVAVCVLGTLALVGFLSCLFLLVANH